MPHKQHQAGVIGDPIKHSRSPELHLAAYQVLGWDCEYRRYQVPAGSGVEFFNNFTNTPQAAGLSVTMPHKSELLQALDHVSERVRLLGALNTIYRQGSTWHGQNTDVDGIIKAFEQATEIGAGQWLILGAGNTAAAAIAAAAESEATKINFVVRDLGRAADSLDLAKKFGVEAKLHLVEEFTVELASEQVAIISTWPPKAADTLLENWADPGQQDQKLPPLLDVAYDPWPSVLASKWHNYGGIIISGLEMLLYQAIEQIKLFAPEKWAAADHQTVLNAMCDAVKLPQRKV